MLYVRECQIFEVERAQAWQRHQLIFTSFLNMCLVIPHLSDLLDLGAIILFNFTIAMVKFSNTAIGTILKNQSYMSR